IRRSMWVAEAEFFLSLSLAHALALLQVPEGARARARARARESLRSRKSMNIHEYQARELFDKFGVAAPRGNVARTAEEAELIAKQLGASELVVKAQVHAGGRGKGTFK